MSRGIPRAKIPPLVLRGMRKAADDWDSLHGSWADKAPEYWFTVLVALELHKGLDENKNWIKLEGNVAKTLSAAGPKRRGRPPRKLRQSGRCDIVIERLNEAPFALVEIKSRAYAFNATLAKDVERLHQALRNKSKLEVACLALYSSASHARTKLGARTTLEKRFDKNLQRAGEICAADLHARDIRHIEQADESNDCWGVQCIYLFRKTGIISRKTSHV